MIKKERLIKLTQKILSFNSENPPGNELALSQFIEKDMRSLNLSLKVKSFTKNRPNVIAILKGSLPRKRAQGRSILITPHFDTVPIGSGWTKSPFGRDIVNSRIYGRGASDDKGNTAVAMEVMRSLVEQGFCPRSDIILAATVDEETGSHCGIIPLLEKKILNPGYALILDSDECDAITVQKGLIHCRVKISGKKAHGAYNWQGKNAIEIAAAVIQDLKKYKFQYHSHKLLHKPTVNIGTIIGGDKVNMVADSCEFSLDLRFLPKTRSGEVLAQVRTIIKKHARTFKIVIDDIQKPYEISTQHPFVSAYLKEARAMGVKARAKGSEGATVMTFFQRFRIPAFATGFGASGTAHTNDEYARIATLYKGACVLERFLKRFDEKR